jgi:hypothetical protein
MEATAKLTGFGNDDPRAATRDGQAMKRQVALPLHRLTGEKAPATRERRRAVREETQSWPVAVPAAHATTRPGLGRRRVAIGNRTAPNAPPGKARGRTLVRKGSRAMRLVRVLQSSPRPPADSMANPATLRTTAPGGAAMGNRAGAFTRTGMPLPIPQPLGSPMRSVDTDAGALGAGLPCCMGCAKGIGVTDRLAMGNL